jgi:endonuclease/exonuclease/phosphatase (EEP) superfamily protein YafD
MEDAASSTRPSEQLRTTARPIENLMAWALCLGVVLGTLVRWLGRWHWLCELTTHFVVQATVLAAGATLLLVIRRHGKLAALSACLTLFNAAEWVPFYVLNTPETNIEGSGESLVVVSANVYSRNRNSKTLPQWLREIRADVVFISEVDPWWAEQIESWKADWPHQIIRPRSDNFGLAIISRVPISQSNVFFLEGDIPAVCCQIEAPCGAWTIVGLHPLPPTGARNSLLRNQQLQTAAERIQSLPAPRVVLGDLNASSSSPVFRDFLSATGLQDSRQGFGWQPTWPAGNRLLRIPIDHCLLEPGVQVMHRSVGPDIGSDHLPVQCQLTRGP